jgi:hypothetical protein
MKGNEMSTELRPLNERTTLTRFWGGKERGVCVQVTQTGQPVQNVANPLGMGYVSLTRQEAAQLGEMLMMFAAGKEEVAE